MILVTGAAGFIGQHLIAALRSGNTAVRAVDDLSTSPFHNPLEAFERLDVLDLRADDLDDVDTIIHLAARKSIPESFEDRLLITRNIEVDRHVLDLVTERPIRRLILASSCEVYGDVGGVLSEDRRPHPRSPYAVGKVATELLADLTSALTTTEICCVRFFNTFGPGEGLDAVVPRFVHDAVHRGSIQIEGSGEQRRYFSFISPVVSILQRLAESTVTPSVVNVAAGEQRSVMEVAMQLQRLIGPFDITHGRPRLNEISGFTPDLRLLRRVVGPTTPTPFIDALRSCVEHEMENGRNEGRVFHPGASSMAS
jgi:dTDP-glucose 4,6-dehydratase/UDP-glucose 4-epimerase